jgi:hypothetical protein
MIAVLADGPGTPIDQGVDTVLLLGTLFFGLVAVTRLRGRGFRRLPAAGAWTFAGLAAATLVLAFVLPPIIRPDVVVSPVRPSSTATISILSPWPGEVFVGDPAAVPVRLRLAGGRIVSFTSSKLVPNTGHIHVYLDGLLIVMTMTLAQEISVSTGRHELEADFVAVDHAPFSPPVRARVSFEVRPG